MNGSAAPAASAMRDPHRRRGLVAPAQGCRWNSHTFPRAQLRQALQEQRLRAVYQTIVRLHDQQPVGQEALARLLTSQGVWVEANAFIDIAAAIGLEARIDTIITAQAMSRSPLVGKMFLNCSSDFLAEPGCTERMRQQHMHWLHAPGGSAPRETPWVLEITERHLHADPSLLHRNLQPLLDLGFELALDDFGGNHSAYPYLAKLPIRYLKIDRALVQASRTCSRSACILRHLLHLAHELQLVTIAEGVEDLSTALRLRDLGVHWGQGFAWFEPLDASETGRSHPQPITDCHSSPF